MKRYLFGLTLLAYVVGVVLFAVSRVHGHPIAVLDPKGVVASKERGLMITATLLMLIVVVPVFILTAAIAWRYRASNTKATYQPEWDHHPVLEFGWWAIPTAIIVVLAHLAWTSSHQLDPYVPLQASAKPLTIQVVALQWKWLFIYPDQQVASVNQVNLPVNTPVNFEITADAPMNSFWIPQLGGQIYAMPGMATQLHLMASQPGSFNGSSANISGDGFASMHFVARVTSAASFNRWVATARQSARNLGIDSYNRLAAPGEISAPVTYASAAPDLFDAVMMKFMTPGSPTTALASVNQP